MAADIEVRLRELLLPKKEPKEPKEPKVEEVEV